MTTSLRLLVLSILLILPALLFPPAAALGQEQAAPVQIDDLLVGYGGEVRQGTWYPVSATVSNDGPDLQAELVWEGEGTRYRRSIDLPRGARKRLTLLVMAERIGFPNQRALQVQVGSQVLAEAQAQVDGLDNTVFVIGVIGDPGLLGSLNALVLPSWSRVRLVPIQAEQVPEQWAGLMGLNVIFVGGPGVETLSDGQRAALASWVQLGGQLVLGGGVSADQTTAGLGELVPATLGGLEERSLSPLATLVGTNRQVQPPTASVRVATARPGAQSLAEGLVVTQARGEGQLVYAAFDVAVLRGWADEDELWAALLQQQPLRDLGTTMRRDGSNPLQSALQLPGLGLPSAWQLFGYLLLYVLLIGPANYLVLRRIDRREWAWMTIPATVLLLAIGIYGLGFGVRGSSVLINELRVVQGSEGVEGGAATSFVGLFSPQRQAYTVSLPADVLVSELAGFSSGPSEPLSPLTGSGEVRLDNLLIDVGSLKTLVVEQDARLPFTVRSKLQRVATGVEGTVELDGVSLEDVLVVSGANAQLIGTLAAGQQRDVQVLDNTNNFPWSNSVSSEGTFNRQQVLNSLFSGTFLAAGATSTSLDDAPFLLAWVEQPATEIRVEGGAASNEATLYIVQLNLE